MGKGNTAMHRLVPTAEGNIYIFFCGVTGAQFQTRRAYKADSPEKELFLAWESEGRCHFNRCQKCRRWVFNVAYNPEVLECIECAPFEDEAKFCKFCGTHVPPFVKTCPTCKKPLYYEGVESYDAKTQI